jgi:uncharacterized protein
VAALSARALADAARAEGCAVVALDVFGDADTRRAADAWYPIGDPQTMRIDAPRMLATLDRLRCEGRTEGWLYGSGFEGRPGLIGEAAARLAVFGNSAGIVRRLRDPVDFFAMLDDARLPHPPVAFDMPPTAETGWLVKHAGGCGGRHIRRMPAARDTAASAGAAAADAHGDRDTYYFQREAAGVPMSATFIAHRGGVRLLGCNALTMRANGAAPFVFCGAVGPVPLPDAVVGRVLAALRTIAAAFALRGLGSLDFLLDGDAVQILEVNPRPSATVVLYPGHRPITDHLRACRGEVLPLATAAFTSPTVRGFETVCAPHAAACAADRALRLAALPGCHDLPYGAVQLAAGDPVCSVEAEGTDAAAVRRTLDLRRAAALDLLFAKDSA